MEKIKAEWIDTDHIFESDFVYRRKQIGGKRYYIKDGKIVPSVTTIIHSSSTMSPFLLKWYADNGSDYCKWFMDQSARYGTLVHLWYGNIILGEQCGLSEEWFNKEIEDFCEHNNYDKFELLRWYKEQNRDFRKDVYAFIKWVQDYYIQPLAVEYPIFNDEYSGTIDLVCMSKGHIFMVDYKTGSGIYDDHGIQLAAYAEQWDIEQPNELDGIFNFRPKQFKLSNRTKTFYEFKNWTKDRKKLLTKFNIYIDLFKLDNEVKEDYIYKDFTSSLVDINTDLNDVIKDFKIKGDNNE